MPLSNNALQMGINAELLRKRMKDLNLNPALIADRKNMSEQTVKNIVYGTTKNPGIENVARVCEELKLKLEEILYTGNTEAEKELIKKEPATEGMKEIYETQVAMLIKAHEKEMLNTREHYERHIAEIKEHYEKRLSDKREHIETILLDKKWFRLASVVSVLAIIALFFVIEFMTPGHGWFTFD